jgi:hypothetical protein
MGFGIEINAAMTASKAENRISKGRFFTDV